MDSAKYHAAVGLAQLGNADGFEWLIANSEDPLPTISNAWPDRVPNLNLDVCSVAALQDLSGETAPKTKQEWETWWDKADKKALPKGNVHMRDP